MNILENSLDEMKQQIALVMEQTMRVYGLPQSVTRIYGMLYVAEGPMSFDEIETTIGMSRATVNNALKTLIDNGSVVKYWDKDRHRNYYLVEKDFFKNFPDFIVSSLRKERQAYIRVADQVKPIVEELAKDTTHSQHEEAKKTLNDMRDALRFYDWLNRFADFLDTGKVFESLPKD